MFALQEAGDPAGAPGYADLDLGDPRAPDITTPGDPRLAIRRPTLIDATDRRILALLQKNARIPAAEIARTIDLAPSAVHHRIRKLEESGVIRGYETRIDPRAVNLPLVSFVRVRTGEGARAPDITRALAALPEVQEVHRVVGEDCFFVKVRVQDPEALADLLDRRIQSIPRVASTHSTIVLTTAKESFCVPVEEAPRSAARS